MGIVNTLSKFELSYKQDTEFDIFVNKTRAFNVETPLYQRQAATL